MYRDDTYNFIRDSIKLAKTNNLNRHELQQKYDSQINRFRSNRFKRFFLPVFDTYQQTLEDNKTIDFEDMINKASELLPKSEYQEKYKYILVDEFQDLSACRTEFLKSLLTTNNYLFGVGDDWQSIYRFTGSDISVMTNFKNKFSNEEEGTIEFEERYIQQTFRTCKDISKVASVFIQANKNQLEKTIRPRELDSKIDPLPEVLNICEVEEYNDQFILKILDKIPKAKPESQIPSVFILGRAGFNFDTIQPKQLMEKRPDLYIEKGTIHKSKGLESDIVILLGLDGGMRGFPNSAGEDPLVSMFLPVVDDHPNSEERRVMYVAMTRAKDSLFLVHKLDPSSFIGDVEAIAEQQNIVINKMRFRDDTLKRCPECKKAGKKGGLKIRRFEGQQGQRNRYRLFLGCNHWRRPPASIDNDPLFCDHTENEVPCPKCLQDGKNGILNVNSIEEDGMRRLYAFCNICDFRKSFYEF